MASSSKSPFKLSIDPKFAEKVGIGALQCVACLGFFFAVRVTIASRTSAVCGFLPARALAPVLEQALDDTIHVGLLPAPNRRLRHPNLALDGIRPEAATRQRYNACVCDDLRSSAYARFSSMAALMGRYKHGVKSTRFSGRLTPSGRGEIAGRDAWQHGLDTQLVQDLERILTPGMFKVAACGCSRTCERLPACPAARIFLDGSECEWHRALPSSAGKTRSPLAPSYFFAR